MFLFIFVQRRAILSFLQTQFSHMQDDDSTKMIIACLLVKISFISARHMCPFNFTKFLPDISDSSTDVVLYMLRTYLQTKECTVFLSYQKLAGLSLVKCIIYLHTHKIAPNEAKHHHGFCNARDSEAFRETLPKVSLCGKDLPYRSNKKASSLFLKASTASTHLPPHT
jgi:hypothetical protein